MVIIDISNPSNPVEVGSLISDPSAGFQYAFSEPRGIYVSGNYAYIATYKSDMLTVVDISNSANPKIVGYSTSATLDGAYNVYVKNNYAYVTSSANNKTTLTTINISNPSNPSVSSSMTVASLASATGIYAYKQYAYIPVMRNDTLVVVDISDPANLKTVGSISSSELDGTYSVYVMPRF